jgi:hypothetical protein
LAFSVFILSYLFSIYRKESFSNIDGQYIDGQYTLQNAPERRHTEAKTPLDSGLIKKESTCSALCLNQSECLDKKTSCKSTYESSAKNCYCQFKSVVEGFDTFDDLLNLPTTTSPSWEAPYFKKMWNPLKIQSLGKWKDLKIKQRNTMSISFWVYFNEHVMLKDPNMRWISLFQVTSPDFKPVSNFDWQKSGNDRYIGIWNCYKTSTLHIRGKTSTNVNEGDPDELSTKVIPGKNYIGFNKSPPTFVVITYIANKYTFYKDGVETNSYTAPTAYVEPDPESNVFSGYVFENANLEPQGISMKDLKVYNGAMDAKTVEMLYNELKDDDKGVGWQSATAEGFRSLSTEGFSARREGFSARREGFSARREGFSARREGFENENDDGGTNEATWGTDITGYEGANQASTYITDNGNTKQLEQPNIVAIAIPEILGMGFRTLQFLTSPEKTQCVFDFGSREITNGQGNPRKGSLAYTTATYDNPKPDKNALTPPFTSSNVQTEIGKYLENPDLLAKIDKDKKKMDGKLTITATNPVFGNNQSRYWTIQKVQNRNNLRSGLQEIVPLLRDFNNGVYNSNYACNSAAPVCSNYIFNMRWGQCSAKSNAESRFKTETVRVIDGEKKSDEKKMTYIQLDPTKEEFLEMPAQFNPGACEKGFSICFWVRIVKNSADNQKMKLFSFCNIIGWSHTDAISIHLINLKVEFQIKENVYTSPISKIADLDWHHIVWTVDKSGMWSVYHNGIGYASNPVKGIYPSSNPRNKQVIGGPISSMDAFLNGSIGDIRFYNGVLSPDEVWTVKNLPR